ncbi:hypothetical protein [Psychromonas aquatilis]|uniref:Uncharacterized protein n=1 Tax=Psychromonas aquatilis TaxID=2005072 RepID=A0ABU9GRT9_9GAMM
MKNKIKFIKEKINNVFFEQKEELKEPSEKNETDQLDIDIDIDEFLTDMDEFICEDTIFDVESEYEYKTEEEVKVCFAFEEVKDFLNNAKKAFKQREALGKNGKGIEIENELSFNIDITGIKIAFREIPPQITIKKYPDDILKLNAAKRKLHQSAIVKPIRKILKPYPNIKFVEDLAETIENDNNIPRNELLKTPEKFFKIAENFEMPGRFTFIPDDVFITFVEKELHQNYSVMFKDFHSYNQSEVVVRPKSGLIDHYENQKMNECLAYLVNKHNLKKYHVNRFVLPPVIHLLILNGEPKKKEKEEGEQPFTVDDGTKIKSIYKDDIHRTFHLNHPFTEEVNVKDFTSYIVNNVKELCFYNYNTAVSKKNIQFDKNKNIIRSVISNFCEKSNILEKDLFKNPGERQLEDLINTYLILFSKYYSLYHSNKIPDDLFTKKKESQKVEADKKKMKK